MNKKVLNVSLLALVALFSCVALKAMNQEDYDFVESSSFESFGMPEESRAEHVNLGLLGFEDEIMQDIVPSEGAVSVLCGPEDGASDEDDVCGADLGVPLEDLWEEEVMEPQSEQVLDAKVGAKMAPVVNAESNRCKRKRIDVGEKPYKCGHAMCKKAFMQRKDLHRHMKLHADERPFPCQYCFLAYSRSDQLADHVKRKHSLISTLTISGHIKKSKYPLDAEGRFLCPIQGCEYSTTGHSNMIRHKRVHSDESLFGCDKCAARFKHNHGLKRHMVNVHKAKCVSLRGAEEARRVDQQDLEYALTDGLISFEQVDWGQLPSPEIGTGFKPRKQRRLGVPDVMVLDAPVENQRCMLCGHRCKTAEEVLAHTRIAHSM